MTIQARKKDAHRKIQLGGLIVKAKLSEESTAVLLGLLLEAANELESTDAALCRERWRLKGDIALTNDRWPID